MHLPSLAATLLVLLPSLPAAQEAPTTERAVITGQIIDSVGCPVPDAALKLKVRLLAPPWLGQLLAETRSDSQGYFAFNPAPVGSYYVEYRYERPGLGGGSGWDPVVLGSTGTSVVFRLHPPSPPDIVDLQVRVTDVDDVPVPAARITWRRRVGAGETWCPTGTLTADGHGRATEGQVPPGTYQISVEADGFAPQSVEERQGWLSGAHTIRLRTVEEAEKAKKPMRVVICCGPAAPRSMRELVHAVDAIVVGRVTRAALDLVSGNGDYPGVRTRYEVQPLEIIKHDPRLPRSTTFSVLHAAGEVEWQGTILLGCERTVMKELDTYVLFLSWNEMSGEFWPAHGNALLANISTGAVVAMRGSNVAPLIVEHEGTSAEKFISEIREAIK